MDTMIVRSLLTVSALAAFSQAAPVKSGHASAEWISGAPRIEGGKPFQTGIRMVIEEGWHSYWLNPGESGMRLKVVWELPEGWTASEVSHPVPKRFLTGDLPGYGYEGEVIFPVTVVPAAGASGSEKLSAKVSWLTCNDASCIPGKVDLTLAPGSEQNAAVISKSLALVPQKTADLKLEVSESQDAVKLTLSPQNGGSFDPTGWEVFPATEQALDHYKPIVFSKIDGRWTATIAKNQYADGALKELELVLAKKGATPVVVKWKAP